MKQAASDKYTIAWFKLAECVSRGERERALGVYRLLSHSIGNPAFEHQLEGDLHLSFNDTQTALEKYYGAVRLYRQAGNILEAAAVLEHVIVLDPHTYTHHQELIELYHQLRLPLKVREHSQHIIDILMHRHDDHYIKELLAMLQLLSEEYYQGAQEYILLRG